MRPDDTTLGDALRDVATRLPDKTALIGAERALTWSQLDEEVDRLATLLADIGIVAGDAVGLCTTKRPEVVTTFLALARLGAIAAPVNFKLEANHIVDQFAVARLRGVLLEARFDDVIEPVVGAVAGRVVYVGAIGRHLGRAYEDQAGMPPASLAGPSPRDPCYYNYTSGTTGRPKGAVHTHAQVLWNALSGVEGLGFGVDEVFLCMFSVFAHPHELFHRALLTGATCVVVDTINPRVVIDLVEKHRVTWMMAVPSFYEMMLDQGIGTSDTASLRVLESGGAWVSAGLLERMEAEFACGFMPVWGSTETCGVALAMPATGARRGGATGLPAPYYEVAIVDDHGRRLPAGESGELWVRGRAVGEGYIGMPQETAEAFVDGWYRTGDLVRVDEAGFYAFVGRRFDMLKVGGIRVFPLEIEQVLCAHPAIAEAVVVRAEERVRGEIPRAVVRLLPGRTLTEAEIKQFCRAHLAVYKVPRIVEIWLEIPKLPNGKIDRRAVEARR